MAKFPILVCMSSIGERMVWGEEAASHRRFWAQQRWNYWSDQAFGGNIAWQVSSAGSESSSRVVVELSRGGRYEMSLESSVSPESPGMALNTSARSGRPPLLGPLTRSVPGLCSRQEV
jgi:hypothetical protein